MCRPHVGYRGSSLLGFAVVDFVWAAYLVVGPPNSTREWFAAVVPIGWWAAVWALVGVVCAVFAFRHDDRHGFEAAIGIKVVWGLGCLIGWVMADVTLGAVGIWLGFAWFVWRISGWPEPRPVGEDRSRDT